MILNNGEKMKFGRETGVSSKIVFDDQEEIDSISLYHRDGVLDGVMFEVYQK